MWWVKQPSGAIALRFVASAADLHERRAVLGRKPLDHEYKYNEEAERHREAGLAEGG